MNITDIHKNAMGTVSFKAKFKGMRKVQDFIVYPNPEKNLKIQSDTYCGIVDQDGFVLLARVPYFAALHGRAQKKDQIENLEALRQAVRNTAGSKVGTSGIVYCDNSTASSF